MDKRMIVTLFATLFVFIFVNLFLFNFFGVPLSLVSITGNALTDVGVVQFVVDDEKAVWIHSPENITYTFEKGEPYLLELNVSADFSVRAVDGWRYSLYDLEHEVYEEEGVYFVPNSSIVAVRWGNLLTVEAFPEDGGGFVSEQVVFTVNVSNSAPLLGNISDPIFACEGQRLNYTFNATDVDEEDLVGDISPKNPFYLDSYGRSGNLSFFAVVSGVLEKGDVGVYEEEISVVDPWDATDAKEVDVEVIEVNNVPSYEDIGAQTVWLQGENSTFYRVFEADDFEDGNSSSGNLFFNLSWDGDEDFFDIDSSYGVMNYTPVVGHEGRVYSLTVCAMDNALGSVHPNISECSPSGADENLVCDNFTLTVTDENRAPIILNYTPDDNIFAVSGTSSSEYYVEVHDADGTVPDIDWYVDGELKEHNEGLSEDIFVHKFGCGVSGAHDIRAVTSDGLLNDSVEWYVNVKEVECPVSSSGGGGGGTFTEYCAEDWACGDWQVCQNVEKSFDSGGLSLEDYSVAKAACSQNKEEDERFCGFQVRACPDLNGCTNEEYIFDKPVERQFCYFTEDPSCSDGITNCHDGACEVLVDCGGPCDACPSCSDGEQNQGEEGVDCGGPCPYLCEPEVPFAMVSSVLIVVAIILVLIILFVLWRLFLLWKRRDKDDDEGRVKRSRMS